MIGMRFSTVKACPTKESTIMSLKFSRQRTSILCQAFAESIYSEETGSSLYYNKFFLSIYILNGNLYANGKAIDGRNIGFEI